MFDTSRACGSISVRPVINGLIDCETVDNSLFQRCNIIYLQGVSIFKITGDGSQFISIWQLKTGSRLWVCAADIT